MRVEIVEEAEGKEPAPVFPPDEKLFGPARESPGDRRDCRGAAIPAAPEFPCLRQRRGIDFRHGKRYHEIGFAGRCFRRPRV